MLIVLEGNDAQGKAGVADSLALQVAENLEECQSGANQIEGAAFCFRPEVEGSCRLYERSATSCTVKA